MLNAPPTLTAPGLPAVFISLFELVIDIMGNDFPVPINPTVLRAFRVFRLTRLLKLVPHSEGLQAVFHTFLEALPVLTNVGMLLFLVFFIYAVLAVQLFSPVYPSDDGEMTSFMNFRNFSRTLFTLFVLATGEHWNAIMHELMESEVGPGEIATVGFFLSFQFLCVFLTLNLFISVVVAYTQKADEEKFAKKAAGDLGHHPTELTLEDVDSYTRAWALSDPNAQGSVDKIVLIEDVILGTASPLGAMGDEEPAETTREVISWLKGHTARAQGVSGSPKGEHIALGTVFFSSLLNQLANRAFGLEGEDMPDPSLGGDSPKPSLGTESDLTANPLNDEGED